MDLGHVIERAGKQFGERVLLTGSSGSTTFADFAHHTGLLARAFLDRGLQPGQRVVIALPNGIDLLQLLYGVIRAGLVAVPIDIRRASSIGQVITDSEAHLLCTTPDIGAALELDTDVELISWPDRRMSASELGSLIAGNARRGTGPQQVHGAGANLAVLLYTSGTTGEPKGVMLSHDNWFHAALGLVMTLELSEGDVAVLATPLTHASGFLFLAQLMRGGRAVLLPRWDPDEFLTMLVQQRATTAFLVPTMLYGLLDSPQLPRADLRSLRVLYYSSAPIDPGRLRSALDVFDARLAQSYGLIEAPMPATVLDQADHQRIASSTAHERRLASVGREFLLSETAIVDASGSRVPDGESGEVIVRGPHVMRGYWKRSEATQHVLREGWLRTGDIGHRDPDGYLYLTDRQADIIVSGGASVSAGLIERVLASHPAVRDVVVVAAPDDYWGEVPVAVVVLRDGMQISPQEILEFGRARLSGSNRPRRVLIESSLPHSENGKLLRRLVRERFWEGRQRRVN